MPKSLRILVLLIAAAAGAYAYYSNWFVELDAEFGLSPEFVSILANDTDYHDCSVKLSWDFSTSVSWVRQNQTLHIPIHQFEQWNGVALESIGPLGREVKISIWCDEGRVSRTVFNRYATQP